MRLLIEFDGPVFDVAPAYYRVHGEVAGELGWSRLDRDTFWRLIRTKGTRANVLPGAKPAKLKAYEESFAERLESDAAVGDCAPRADIGDTLATLSRHGTCCLLTVGSNLSARQRAVQRAGLSRHFARIDALDPDPRRRPVDLRAIAEGCRRTLVAAAGDVLLRAAGDAGLLPVGISSGACTPARLHQAGAAVVYRDLSELAASLRDGAHDLIQAGLLPPSLD